MTGGKVATVCSTVGCPKPAVRAGRCSTHAPKPWAGSPERRRELGLPGGSVMQRIARVVRARARHRCEVCGRRVALGEGAVDHRVPIGEGGATIDANAVDVAGALANLRLSCDECHNEKTKVEAARARALRSKRGRQGGGRPRRLGARELELDSKKNSRRVATLPPARDAPCPVGAAGRGVHASIGPA